MKINIYLIDRPESPWMYVWENQYRIVEGIIHGHDGFYLWFDNVTDIVALPNGDLRVYYRHMNKKKSTLVKKDDFFTYTTEEEAE